MSADPKKSVTPTAISELAKNEVDHLLQAGLADLSLRELLGLLISSAGVAERNVYLEKIAADKPNGFYDRSLQVATESSGRQACRLRTAVVIAKKSSRCCWDCSARAARLMPLRMLSRRWACPTPNRI